MLTEYDALKEGDRVNGHCKCGQVVLCTMKKFSNGTLHALGECSKCGLKGYKQLRMGMGLEELKHKLMGLRSNVLGIPKGANRDEAVAMIERTVEELSKEL